MTDSIDKKSKEKRDNLDVDLDAMLDEAESSLVQMNELQDDEDAIDRLLINAGFDADDAPVQSNEEEDVSVLEELDDFSDFSDFNEPEMVLQGSPRTAAVEEVDESEQATGNSSAVVDDADEVDDFFGFGDDFDESDMIQDDEVEASALAVADLIAPNEGQQAVVEESGVEEDANAFEELDVFPDFSDFNEPEMIPAVEVEESEQTTENSSSHVDDAGLSDEVDDFDESDMIQDDEVKASAPAVADLIAPNEAQQTVVEESFNDLQDIARDGVYAASQSGTGAADENGIDSLLMDAGFDAEDMLEQTAGKKDEFGDDADLNEIDGFFQLDEVSDDFSRQTEEVQLAETEKLSTQDDQEDDFLLPDFDITADMSSDAGIREDELVDAFGDTDFLNEDEVVQAFEPETAELKSGGNEAGAEPTPKQAADTAIEDVGNVRLSPFGFEQEDIKKQLEDAENKVKKAKLFSYVALGFGVVALSAAAGLGVMTYGAKTEVSRLTEAVSTLEASLTKSTANNPKEEIDAMRNSVVQLNQQVDGFITELKGDPQFPVDLLNNKVPDIVAKQDMVSKALDMLQLKVTGLEGKVSSEPVVAESPKVEAAHEPAPAKEGNVHEIPPVKTGAVHEHEPTKEGVAHEPAPTKEGTAHEIAQVKTGAVHEHAPGKEEVAHEIAPTKERTAHKIAPAKERAMHETVPAKVEAVPETAPAKVKTQPEAVTAKPITTAKAVFKQEPVKVKRPAATANWGVNLVAFKQEWYAKSKAAEFARLGVFAEVMPVHEKNTTMYRLRVGGFKSKAEAYSNTARIKKALNLDSVWVSDN